MEQPPSLVISQEDFHKISAMLPAAKIEIAELLADELSRAQLVSPEELPKDRVSMNSVVKFIDLDTGKEQAVTLAYPQDADIQTQKVSIFAPIGAALIGLRVGQSIDWPVSDTKVRRIKVVGVDQS